MSDLLVNLVSKSSALLTSQKTRITGICICLVLAIVESVSSWRNLNSYGMFFSIIYVVALLLMIWFPIPASMGLCICSIVSDIMPILIVSIPDYWGTWLGIGILAFSCKPLYLSMGSIVAFFSFIGNLNQPTVTLSGNVFVSCTYVIASLVGFTIAQWLESARLQEEKAFQEQELIYERKRLQLTQTIHDSVAGSLSYGVLRMRQIESTLHHQDEELIASLGDVEDIMRQALTSIRSEILESSNVTLHENGKDSDVFCNEEDLRTVLLDMKHRLDALGFDGEALLVGDTERITHIPREVVGIIRELGNNISKYAEKSSSYALIVSLRTSQKLDIYEANVSTEHNDDTLSGGTGFNRIRQVVNLLGGECNAGVEEREWCVFIQLPLPTAL